MKKQRTKLMSLALSLVLIGGMTAGASAANTDNDQLGLVRQGLRAAGQQAQGCLQTLADLTGLSITEIRHERTQGKSLAAIAESQGIDEQTIIDQIIAERTSTLDQLKANNKISAAQYEYCITNMPERVQANLDRTDIGCGQGNHSQWGDTSRARGAGQCRGMANGMGVNQGACPYLNAQP